MISAIILLCITLALSLDVVRSKFHLRGFSLLAISVMMWLLSLMWGSFLFSWLFGFSVGSFVFLLVTLVVAIGYLMLRSADHSKPVQKFRILFRKSTISALAKNYSRLLKKYFRQFWFEGLVIVCICTLMGSLLYSRMLPIASDGLYSGGSTWGDLALHTAFISHFASQNHPDFTNPIYSGEKNTYPWLFDFYTAWLVRSGFSLRSALLLSSWQALIGLAIAFIAISRRLVLKRAGLAAATTWFFLAGGLGFVYLIPDKVASKYSWWQFFSHMPQQYTNMFNRGVYFSTPITDILLPQRGALIGLGIVISVIVLISYWLQSHQHRQLMLAGIAIGCLPLIHFHSFLAGGGYFLLAGVLAIRNKQILWHWLVALTLLVAIAIPQLFWMTSGGQVASFLAIDGMWMLDMSVNTTVIDIVKFLLLNFSLVFAIALVSGIILPPHKKSTTWWLLYLSLLGILALTLSIRFQPNPYDNIKLLLVALLSASLLAGMVADKWWPKRSWLVVALILLGSLSGALSITREFFQNYLFVANQELLDLQRIQVLLPPDSVIAAAPYHHFFLNTIGGYTVYLGYPGWLWTHGVDYSDREQILRDVYQGDADAIHKLLQSGVDYLVLSHQEKLVYQINPLWYQQPAVISLPNIVIVDVWKSSLSSNETELK